MAREPFRTSRRGDASTMAAFMRDQVLTGKATALHVTTEPDGFEEVLMQVVVADPREPPDEDGFRGRVETQVVLVPRRRITSIDFERAPAEPTEPGQPGPTGPTPPRS